MRMSRLFLRTLRDDPADAEVDSHRLLTRAGYIRKVASGIYSWLPLGSRVLRRIEDIVRSEMDAAGAQEMILPIIQPLELWERSGRDAAYGPMMFRLDDRKETGFCLSPTAEEAIAATVAGEYSSYRDLPVTLYQINWKYRDELRPRFGLLRGREFLMMDAYSFDVDEVALAASYRTMYEAYHKVFERCGLTFRPVRAQAGEIGGDVNHEFMAVAAVGEDDFVWCHACDYAANVEAAIRKTDDQGPPTLPGEAPVRERVQTPGLGSISAVASFLNVGDDELLKCIAFDVDGDLGLALVPGNREINPFALTQALAPKRVRLYDEGDFAAHRDLVRGYIGPDAPGATVVVADPSVRAAHGWVTGANEIDHHVRDAWLDRDFRVDAWVDLVAIVPGDPCPECGAPLAVDRGIEVGHVFQLGTKYSEVMGASYTDDQSEQHPMLMGCYGIGVSRLVAAIAEEHHDDAGLCWPAAIAPYDVHLLALAGKGAAAEQTREAADAIYEDLVNAGFAVLYDDRDASAGVKFADADLLGMPVQLTVGAKGLARGVVERKIRATGERDEVLLGAIVQALGV